MGDWGTPKRWEESVILCEEKNPVKRPMDLRKLSQISEKKANVLLSTHLHPCLHQKKTLQILVGTYF